MGQRISVIPGDGIEPSIREAGLCSFCLKAEEHFLWREALLPDTAEIFPPPEANFPSPEAVFPPPEAVFPPPEANFPIVNLFLRLFSLKEIL